MRIYLPLAASDRDALLTPGAGRGRGGDVQLLLDAGRRAWALTAEARADRPGEDAEDLEFDAALDAAFAAIEGDPDADHRAVILAGDVPDAAIASATETGGAFGITLPDGALLRLASIFVTELSARAARADDTDPALLWFDAGEARDALGFAVSVDD